MITINPPWFTIGSEIYPFIDDYLNYVCIKYMKIFDVRLAMNCLEIFTDELFESRNAILIDNKSSTIINISHSKEDGYYFLGLNLMGQITSRGILSRNDSKGLN